MLTVILLDHSVSLCHSLQEFIPLVFKTGQLQLIFFGELSDARVVVRVILNEGELLLDRVKTSLKLGLFSSDLSIPNLIALELFKFG